VRHDIFLKLLFSFIAVLAVFGLLFAALFAHHEIVYAAALIIALAAVISIVLTRSASRHLDKVDRFAGELAAGRLGARVDDPGFSSSATTTRKLDQGMARLEQEFQALESRRGELEALLDSMQEAVIAVDAHGRVHWTNGVMERVLGQFAGPVRVGHALVQTLRDPTVLACVEEAITHKTAQTGRSTSLIPGRVFEVNAAPMPGGGAVVVLHDVTEVERVERTLRDFIANVSHELRTPLTSISGYVETLHYDERITDDAREFLDIILRNATRMHRLIEDLLALARVESGEFRPRFTSIPANRLLDDAVALLSGMLRETDVALERGDITETPVLADCDSIQQVFSNLIENAVRYGGPGKTVIIGARDLPGAVEFYVTDHGSGIGSEHLDRIFERFYRVDKARSRESGGTGLGLAIARHIMLAHSGSIRAESELHKGSTFIFTLPVAPRETHVDQAEAEAAADEKGTAGVGSL
jgi:two-component system phosphate regulon sensor histidine kinase PhoR